jgi:hypothetical protein
VSNLAYYSLWLAAALLTAAVLSAAIAKHLRLRELRRAKAAELLEALERYSEWAAVQCRSTFFNGESEESASALEEARLLKSGWFPELSAELLEFFAVHNRMIDFLWTQQVLRLKDPEAWLESDHDARFVQLWRQHRHAVESIADKLSLLVGGDSAISPHASEPGFPVRAR